MPSLPTLTITDAQGTRILAAFGNVENYKDWLKQSVIQYVQQHETAQLYQTFQDDQSALAGDIMNELT